MTTTFTTAKRLFVLAAACSSMMVSQVYAQSSEQGEKHCGTDVAYAQLFSKYPGLQQQAEERQQQSWAEGKRNLEASTSRDATPPLYIIPVVFHIIHDYGTENISDAQVLDEMAQLNTDYRKMNSDTSEIVPPFDTIAADCQIEFRLAQVDPDGHCTNGIDRIASMETYVGDDGSKLNQWPRDKYLNVWVVHKMAAGLAGYAYYPGAVDGFLYPVDGVIILDSYIGNIGTSIPLHARALTHEIGHFLSLSHPWGSTNNPGVACGDDGILDTPETMGWTVCELVNNDICVPGVHENVQNYMEYSYCQRMFTYGQKAAMHYALNSSIADRNNLWSATNLAATGCLNPPVTCSPHADFHPAQNMICENGTLFLNDDSWSGNATSWNWTVTGPASYTSTSQNPSFPGLTPGWYSVKLVASNSNGSDSITKQNCIYVSTNAATFTSTYSEGFENPNVFYLGYVSNNRYGNASYFQQTPVAAHTGTGSAVLNTFGNCIQGDVDELITPSYYLYGATGAHLTFWYSYATAATASVLNTQQLRVMRSTDCGATWSQLRVISGNALVNGGYDPGNYVPQNQGYWSMVDITLPTSALTANVRFKFEFTSPGDDDGNNLYIDDINITSTNVGVTENTDGSAFDIYPNPGDGNSTIAYSLAEPSEVTTTIYDMSGRLVRNVFEGMQSEGAYTMSVSDQAHPLAPGTYMIRMTMGDKVSTRKFVVTSVE